MKKKLYASAGLLVAIVMVSGFALSADAAGTPPVGWTGKPGAGHGMMMKRAPGIFGNVTAVNGTTLTVTGRGFATSTTPTQTVYTVDATNATVTKGAAASTVSAIVVGDNVMVTGTINGTSVTATKIFDGKMGMGMMGKPGMRAGGFKNSTSTPLTSGNGQPIIGGTVSVVNGTMITITNKSATYTIDASAAKITKSGAPGTISSVAVGDSILAQGTINGTAVAAVTVTDGGSVTATSGTPSTNPTSGTHSGFFGKIGNFFSHLFGF